MLLRAIKDRKESFVLFLLEKEGVPTEIKDEVLTIFEWANENENIQNGKDALILACEEGLYKVVKVIVQKGANVDSQDNVIHYSIHL